MLPATPEMVETWNEIAEKADAFDFVLSKFNSDENKKLKGDIFPKIAELIDEFITGTHASTSHKL